ncbi:hypothetical protein QBC41DRAFT_338944 [Cercophora samala]|uniref:Uncharacterized protein n=1 Tax=Cercophora samala TaxID=330535 RepID=A0AA39Z960_9PEZI|nr:hypothetical protein QBC41DRAFT_338944 [Cercophora samala]
MSFPILNIQRPPRGCGSGVYSADYCDDVINTDTGTSYAEDALRRLGRQFGTVMDLEKTFLVRQIQHEVPFDLALECRGAREMAHKVIVFPQALRLMDTPGDKSEKNGVTTFTFAQPLDSPWMITRARHFLYTRQYDDTEVRVNPFCYLSGESIDPVRVINPDAETRWEPGRLFLHLHMYLFAQRYGIESLSRYAVNMFHKVACLPKDLAKSQIAGDSYMEMLDLVYSNPHDEMMTKTLCHLVAGDVHTRAKGLQKIMAPLKKYDELRSDFIEHEHKMLHHVFKYRHDLSGSTMREAEREWQLRRLRKLSEQHEYPIPGPRGSMGQGPSGSRAASGPAGM